MKRILVSLVPILVLLLVFSTGCDKTTVPAQLPSSTGEIAFVSNRDAFPKSMSWRRMGITRPV